MGVDYSTFAGHGIALSPSDVEKLVSLKLVEFLNGDTWEECSSAEFTAKIYTDFPRLAFEVADDSWSGVIPTTLFAFGADAYANIDIRYEPASLPRALSLLQGEEETQLRSLCALLGREYDPQFWVGGRVN